MNYGNDMTLRTPLTLYWRFVSPIKNQTIYLQAEEWKTVTITFIKYTQFTMLLTNNIGNNKENIVLNTTEYLMHFNDINDHVHVHVYTSFLKRKKFNY